MKDKSPKTTERNPTHGDDPESGWCSVYPEAWVCRLRIEVDRLQRDMDRTEELLGKLLHVRATRPEMLSHEASYRLRESLRSN